METRLGHSFAHVRVHADERAAASARAVHARAYTVGRDIVFGAGQFSPHTAAGRLLIAHELTHVVQQRGKLPGETIDVQRSDHPAEREAGNVALLLASGAAQPAMGRPSQTVAPGLARAGLGEMWDAVTGVGPLDAMTANNLATEALAEARRTGLPGLHNGPADAWRHCYWNCRMKGELGVGQAKTIADNHESHGGGALLENVMDFHNNAVGRACGGGSCDRCCQSDLDSGLLLVLDATGALVPSSATKRPGAAGSKTRGSYYP